MVLRRITLPACFSFLSIFSMVRFEHCGSPVGEGYCGKTK